jgi:hypothetical protein
MGELVVTKEARASDARPAFRDAFNGWFVTHEVAWELAMAALAVIYVALGFLVDEVDAGKRPEIEAVDSNSDSSRSGGAPNTLSRRPAALRKAPSPQLGSIT